MTISPQQIADDIREEFDVPVRVYSKSELAAMYFPQAPYQTAIRILRNWIYRCLPLKSALLREGYRIHNSLLTPRQVRLIFHYLGEPG